MTFGFFRARILTHFRAAALGFEPMLPGSLSIVSKQVREIILTMWQQSRLANIGQLAA